MDPGPEGSDKPLYADFESGAEDNGVAAAKAAIRAEMRRRRAGLSPDALAAAGAAAAARLRSLPVMRAARLVAAYRAVRGEIPLEDLMEGPPPGPVSVSYTLPRVRGRDLEFAVCRPGRRFEPGAFGIPEPVGGEVVALVDHDVVLVPVVAFDTDGYRVGQGRGFYDRALAARPASRPGADLDPGLRARGQPEAAGRSGPVLIGVAHSFQQVDEAPRHPWDAALDAVVTESGLVEVAPRP